MNETILVIDDEPKIVKQARDYLERGGFRVVTAGDGKMALAVARNEVVPVFCGSAKLTYGMKALLRKMVELFPHPGETRGETASRPGLDQEVKLHADDTEPFAALVFKTALRSGSVSFHS